MYPRMIIDLDKLKHNANTMARLCAKSGISCAAVTKVYCADMHVVKALADTEIEWLADSRIENIKNYPLGHGKRTLLLRAPAPDLAEETVRFCDASLNSEMVIMEALANAASRQKKTHGIILMVDLGDLREGIYHGNPEAIFRAAEFAHGHDNLELLGLGVNLTCYGAIIPTREKMEKLAEIAKALEDRLGVALPVVSGGNSSSLSLLLEGEMPPGITQLRLGESIARAEETAYQKAVPGLEPDAMMLEAKLVEVQKKPSYPEGEIGLNAFGEKTHFEDKGDMVRGILYLGRQDTEHEGISCTDKGVYILGASSDHVIVDLTHGEKSYRVGNTLRFSMNYSAILRGFTSEYVHREYIGG